MTLQIKSLIKGSDKPDDENFDCTYFGDFDLSTGASTFHEAVLAFNEIQQQQKSGATNHYIPKTAKLLPLSKFKGLQEKPFHYFKSTGLEIILESFHPMIMKANDLRHNDICSKFGNLRTQIEDFVAIVERYRDELKRNIAELLPIARISKADEKKLMAVVSSVGESPFNKKNMSNFLENKSTEIQVLSEHLNKLNELNVRFDNFNGLLRDSQTDNVVCFAFHVVSKTNTYIKNLEIFRDMEDLKVLSTESKEWFTCQTNRLLDKELNKFIKIVRNSTGFNVTFAATDHIDEANASDPVIFSFQNGTAVSFQPGMPYIAGTQGNFVTFAWEKPETGPEVTFYCVHLNSLESCRQVRTQNSDTKIVISNLVPDVDYTCSVQAVNDTGASDASNEAKIILQLKMFVKRWRGKQELYELRTKDKKKAMRMLKMAFTNLRLLMNLPLTTPQIKS